MPSAGTPGEGIAGTDDIAAGAEVDAASMRPVSDCAVRGRCMLNIGVSVNGDLGDSRGLNSASEPIVLIELSALNCTCGVSGIDNSGSLGARCGSDTASDTVAAAGAGRCAMRCCARGDRSDSSSVKPNQTKPNTKSANPNTQQNHARAAACSVSIDERLRLRRTGRT